MTPLLTPLGRQPLSKFVFLSLLLVLLGLAQVSHVSAGGGPCSNSDDCYQNSACVLGVCECDADWRGLYCDFPSACPPGMEPLPGSDYENAAVLSQGCVMCPLGEATATQNIEGTWGLSGIPDSESDVGIWGEGPCEECHDGSPVGAFGCDYYNDPNESSGGIILIYLLGVLVVGLCVGRYCCRADEKVANTSLFFVIGVAIVVGTTLLSLNNFQDARDIPPAQMNLWTLSDKFVDVGSQGRPVCTLFHSDGTILISNYFTELIPRDDSAFETNPSPFNSTLPIFVGASGGVFLPSTEAEPEPMTNWNVSGLVEACALDHDEEVIWLLTRESTNDTTPTLSQVNFQGVVLHSRVMSEPLVEEVAPFQDLTPIHSWKMRTGSSTTFVPWTWVAQMLSTKDYLLLSLADEQLKTFPIGSGNNFSRPIGDDGEGEANFQPEYLRVARPTAFVFDVSNFDSSSAAIAPLSGGEFTDNSATPSTILGDRSNGMEPPKTYGFDPLRVSNGMPEDFGNTQSWVFVTDDSSTNEANDVALAYSSRRNWRATYTDDGANPGEFVDIKSACIRLNRIQNRSGFFLDQTDPFLSLCWPRVRTWTLGTQSAQDYALGPEVSAEDIENGITFPDGYARDANAGLFGEVQSFHIQPRQGDSGYAFVVTADGIGMYEWPIVDTELSPLPVSEAPLEGESSDGWLRDANVKVVPAVDVLRIARPFSSLEQVDTSADATMSRTLINTVMSRVAFDWEGKKAVMLDVRFLGSSDEQGQAYVRFSDSGDFKGFTRMTPVLAPSMRGLQFVGESDSGLVGMFAVSQRWTNDSQSPTIDGDGAQLLCGLSNDEAAPDSVVQCNNEPPAGSLLHLSALSSVEPVAYLSVFSTVTRIGYLVVIVVLLLFGYWYAEPHVDAFSPPLVTKLDDPFMAPHIQIYVSMALEALQIAAFAFQATIPWPADSGVVFFMKTFPLANKSDIMNWINVELGAEIIWTDLEYYELQVSQWLSVFLLLVIALFFCGTYDVIFRVSRGKSALLGPCGTPVSLVLVPLMSSVAFLPILRTLIEPLVCQIDPTTGLSTLPSAPVGSVGVCFDPVTSAISGIDALNGAHIALAIASLASLWLFYPMALRASGVSQAVKLIKGQQQQIYWSPRYLFLLIQAKFIMAGVAATTLDRPQFYTPAVTAVGAYMVYVTVKMKPSGIVSINRLRTALLASATAANAASVVTYALGQNPASTGLNILMVGWILTISGIWFVAPRRWFEPLPPQPKDVSPNSSVPIAIDKLEGESSAPSAVPSASNAGVGNGEGDALKVMAETLAKANKALPTRLWRGRIALLYALAGVIVLTPYWYPGYMEIVPESLDSIEKGGETDFVLVNPPLWMGVLYLGTVGLIYNILFLAGLPSQRKLAGKWMIPVAVLIVVNGSAWPSGNGGLVYVVYLAGAIMPLWAILSPDTTEAASNVSRAKGNR